MVNSISQDNLALENQVRNSLNSIFKFHKELGKNKNLFKIQKINSKPSFFLVFEYEGENTETPLKIEKFSAEEEQLAIQTFLERILKE